MGKIKILVVEDDTLLQDSLVSLLESEGYQASATSNGSTAKQLTDQEFYNIILLDLNLPDTSGLELSKSIRQTYPRMRKILLTGYNEEQLSPELLKKYTDASILKPFQIDHLLDIISTQLKAQRKEQ